MKERKSLFGKVDQYFKNTADGLRVQARRQGGAKGLWALGSASLHKAIASEITTPLKKLEEKLRGIK